LFVDFERKGETMNASSTRQQLRSAVTLNNIGAALFEKGCYVQALATFQDASWLMVQLELQDDHELLFPIEHQCEDVQNRLSSANRRLAKPDTPHQLTVPTIDPNARAYPMRIDLDEASDLTLELATVLHNVGISSLYKAFLEHREDEAAELLSAAIRNLTTAYETFVEYDALTLDTALPAINSLCALTTSYVVGGLMEAASRCSENLLLLRRSAEEMFQECGRLCQTAAIGAAAA
jgi:hypothetical protein